MIRPSLSLNFAGTRQLDRRISFSRASTASYYGADGLLRIAAAGEPRFDHDPSTGKSLGLLIEESRENLLTYSEQFDNAAWTKTRASISENATTAPDGTLTADKLIDSTDAETTHLIAASVSVTAGVTYTMSVFLKGAERTWAQMLSGGTTFGGVGPVVDLSTGTIYSVAGSPVATSIVAIGNGWHRVSVTVTASTTSTGQMQIRLAVPTADVSYTGDGTSGIYIWGAQIEAGAFPTSYIPTTTAAVTRSADAASMTGTNFSSWYRAAGGTLFTRHRPIAVTGTRPILSLDDNTANERIELRGTSANPELYVIDGAGNSTTLDGGTLAANTEARIAAAFSASDLAICVNGGAAVTGSETLPTVDRLRLGTDGTNTLSGHLSHVAFYPSRLSNAKLQLLTA